MMRSGLVGVLLLRVPLGRRARASEGEKREVGSSRRDAGLSIENLARPRLLSSSLPPHKQIPRKENLLLAVLHPPLILYFHGRIARLGLQTVSLTAFVRVKNRMCCRFVFSLSVSRRETLTPVLLPTPKNAKQKNRPPNMARSASSFVVLMALLAALLCASVAHARVLTQGGVDMSSAAALPPASSSSSPSLNETSAAAATPAPTAETAVAPTPKRMLLQVAAEQPQPQQVPQQAPQQEQQQEPAPAVFLPQPAAANATGAAAEQEAGRRRARHSAATPAAVGNSTSIASDLTAAAVAARGLQNDTEATAAVKEAGRRHRGAGAARKNQTEAGEIGGGVPECDDKQPSGSEYSCEQQKDWGKCSESWMTDGGFCRKTCNAWPCAGALAATLESVAQVVNATYPVEMGVGGAAAANNQTTVVAQPQPAAAVQPQPAAAVQPQPAAAVQPQPAAAAAPVEAPAPAQGGM
jgi:hypothetical protein